MRNKFLILALLCVSSNSLNAQLTCREFLWAVFHPVAAIKVKCIDKKCDAVYDTINKGRLDNYSNGGKLDAFRHTFYMAAFAQKVKVKKIRRLGEIHERSNYRQFKKSRLENGEIPDSLSSVMDLKNNEVGFTIGSSHKKVDILLLKELVIEEIKLGGAFIMKRNEKGKYVDCQGNELILHEKSWNVPKCLVSSQ